MLLQLQEMVINLFFKYFIKINVEFLKNNFKNINLLIKYKKNKILQKSNLI